MFSIGTLLTFAQITPRPITGNDGLIRVSIKNCYRITIVYTPVENGGFIANQSYYYTYFTQLSPFVIQSYATQLRQQEQSAYNPQQMQVGVSYVLVSDSNCN